jgi:hypothetical protein
MRCPSGVSSVYALVLDVSALTAEIHRFVISPEAALLFSLPKNAREFFLDSQQNGRKDRVMGGSNPNVRIVALLCLLVTVGISAGAAAAKPSYKELDAFQVRQRISRQLPKINRCYETALRREPALAGKIAVHFAVAKKGDVQEVKVVENTTGNDQVGRCVTRIVQDLTFQRRKYGKNLVRFTFPFVFAPQR